LGGAMQHACETQEMHKKFWFENLKVTDGRKILKWILNNYDVIE
jgi:hypothetical protein